MTILSENIISSIFRPRAADSHKGDHGHALLVAGSLMKTGAAVIAARACLRAGAGLVTVHLPFSERYILQAAVPEAMLSLSETEPDISMYSCIGMGPAMGTGNRAKKILSFILKETKKPLILDADAITVLAKNKKLQDKLPAGTILTPHPKEFDRLFGKHENEDERRKKTITKAKEDNIIIVLKGHHTLITNGNESFINNTGNAGLAKGGSGDALTGIITALLAQKYSPFDAARLGVYLHGLAADLTSEQQSPESMLITDVIENLGKAFKKIVSAV